MTKNYDRRVPETLVQALEPGGFAHSLVEYGSSGMWGLDLQFRGLAPKPGRWATLYVGTTKVLDLHVDPKDRFKLAAHGSYANPKNGWEPEWTAWRRADDLADRWPLVDGYLESAIAQVITTGSHLKEGITQAAIRRHGGSLTMIDREAVVGYSTDAERKRHLKSVAAPWIAAAELPGAAQWWLSSAPKTASNECDLLAVDRSGRLVTIEVKPATATASAIAWSPVQARMYADIFQGWLDEHRDDAPDIIAEMLQQQHRIGLRSRAATPRLDPTQPVRALVAIDARMSNTARGRLDQVLAHFDGIGKPLGVEVTTVNLIGRVRKLAVG